ncbi:MAG: hypothetical protein CYPHOPRED_004087 [Cyphobasidiales sp. Tagirdzhanova-0007]|nr:MAG: hypothetical protein CYPHOPRED_004087 [Cyphobasidiales sp. Tagirdzhanova-0007]
MDPTVATFVPSRGRKPSINVLSSNPASMSLLYQDSQEESSSSTIAFGDHHNRSTSANDPAIQDSSAQSNNYIRSHSLPGGVGANNRGRGASLSEQLFHRVADLFGDVGGFQPMLQVVYL